MVSFTDYPSFVVFLAIFLGAILTMALMPVFIRFLRRRLIGQQVRADGPESHLVKQGTPTMGGVIMLIAATVVVFFLAEPVPETWLIMGAVLVTGALGLFDDASKVVHERSLGLTPKAKLVGQFLIATLFVLAAVNWLRRAHDRHSLRLHDRSGGFDHHPPDRDADRGPFHPVALPRSLPTFFWRA